MSILTKYSHLLSLNNTFAGEKNMETIRVTIILAATGYTNATFLTRSIQQITVRITCNRVILEQVNMLCYPHALFTETSNIMPR